LSNQQALRNQQPKLRLFLSWTGCSGAQVPEPVRRVAESSCTAKFKANQVHNGSALLQAHVRGRQRIVFNAKDDEDADAKSVTKTSPSKGALAALEDETRSTVVQSSSTNSGWKIVQNKKARCREDKRRINAPRSLNQCEQDCVADGANTFNARFKHRKLATCYCLACTPEESADDKLGSQSSGGSETWQVHMSTSSAKDPTQAPSSSDSTWKSIQNKKAKCRKDKRRVSSPSSLNQCKTECLADGANTFNARFKSGHLATCYCLSCKSEETADGKLRSQPGSGSETWQVHMVGSEGGGGGGGGGDAGGGGGGSQPVAPILDGMVSFVLSWETGTVDSGYQNPLKPSFSKNKDSRCPPKDPYGDDCMNGKVSTSQCWPKSIGKKYVGNRLHYLSVEKVSWAKHGDYVLKDYGDGKHWDRRGDWALRSELSAVQDGYIFHEGDYQYFTMHFWLDETWDQVHKWSTLIAQWKMSSPSASYPHAALRLSNTGDYKLWFKGGGTRGTRSLWKNSGPEDTVHGGRFLGVAKKRAWNQIKIFFKKSRGRDGFAKVWFNGDFVFEHYGATLLNRGRGYTKFGMYTNIMGERIIYFDAVDFCHSADKKKCLGGATLEEWVAKGRPLSPP